VLNAFIRTWFVIAVSRAATKPSNDSCGICGRPSRSHLCGWRRAGSRGPSGFWARSVGRGGRQTQAPPFFSGSLFGRVAAHREIFFSWSWVNSAALHPSALRFLAPVTTLKLGAKIVRSPANCSFAKCPPSTKSFVSSVTSRNASISSHQHEEFKTKLVKKCQQKCQQTSSVGSKMELKKVS
jgi:hypothetical protein